MNFILDLDETVIHSVPINQSSNPNSSGLDYHEMTGYFYVYERPHLQDFLDYLFKHYKVSIWTAASKDYATFIIDKIILAGKPERKIEYFLFNYHCRLSGQITPNCTKNLSMLWDTWKIPGFSPDNTILMDDYIENTYVHQKYNCIIAMPFNAKDKYAKDDMFLLEVLDTLKENNGKVDAHVINSKPKITKLSNGTIAEISFL